MPNKGRGGVTHGMSESPTYKHYFHIRGRFGRDTFCDHWQTFENFFADMGQRPSLEHSLARINPNQPFKPGNAVWKKR